MTGVMTGMSPKQAFIAQSLTPFPVKTLLNEEDDK